MVTMVPNSCTGKVIPKAAFEAVAEVLLPMIQEYYSHEDNCQKFRDWQAKQQEEISKNTNSNSST